MLQVHSTLSMKSGQNKQLLPLIFFHQVAFKDHYFKDLKSKTNGWKASLITKGYNHGSTKNKVGLTKIFRGLTFSLQGS